MTKPATVPVWATSGPIVVPSAGKQDDGWDPGEQPPAQYRNWLDNLFALWCAYLDSQSLEGDLTVEDDIIITNGVLKHPAVAVILDASQFLSSGFAGTPFFGGGNNYFQIGSGENGQFPLRVETGMQLIGYSVHGQNVSGGAHFEVELWKSDGGGLGKTTQLGSTQSSGTTATTFYTPGETLGTPHNIVDGSSYAIYVAGVGGAVNITHGRFVFARV